MEKDKSVQQFTRMRRRTLGCAISLPTGITGGLDSYLRVVWGDYLKQASPWGMCRIRIIAEGTLARRCGIEMPFLERRSCFLGMDCVYRGAAVVELGAAVEI